MLNFPDVYPNEVALGGWSPVPWYYHYIVAADRLHCPPWVLIPDYGTDDGWTPPEFWAQVGLIVAGAEQDHQEFRRKHPKLFT